MGATFIGHVNENKLGEHIDI